MPSVCRVHNHVNAWRCGADTLVCSAEIRHAHPLAPLTEPRASASVTSSQQWPLADGSVKKPTGPRIIKLARENIAPGGAIRDPRGLGIHFRTPRKGSFCGRAGFFTDPLATGTDRSGVDEDL